MAYLIPGRLCAHVLKTLCTYEEISQAGRKSFTTFVKTKKIPSFSKTVNILQHYATPEKTCFRKSQIKSSHDIDPFKLLENDIKDIYFDIQEELGRQTNNSALLTIATYYMDGRGKRFRPLLIILMARAINCHLNKSELLPSQRQFAMIIEMYHASTLVLDDIIDEGEFRYGKPSINVLWKDKQTVMVENFIKMITLIMTAKLKNNDVTVLLNKIVADVTYGELLQIGFLESEYEGLELYLETIACKTSSMFANSLKAVVLLGGADEKLSDIAYQYGYNFGIAYQLIDDTLDFLTDMKQGVITPPVLFACQQCPELNELVVRKFQQAGDVEKAVEIIHKSKSIEKTRHLAKKHCQEADRLVKSLIESPYQKGLLVVLDLIYNRKK